MLKQKMIRVEATRVWKRESCCRRSHPRDPHRRMAVVLPVNATDLFGFTEATSNDGFCAGGVCDATGITAVAMRATTNTTLLRCRISSPMGYQSAMIAV